MNPEEWTRSTGCPTHFFSLIVVRHPKTHKWLAVEESRSRGWWLPGGFVENGDNHHSTAHKETLEEAGIEVRLLGILHIQSDIRRTGARQRVIYYAEPKDPNQELKSVPDEESLSAKWLTIAELEHLARRPPPAGLRGHELLVYAQYVEQQKGPIYPLSLLSMSEHDNPVLPSKEERARMK